MKNRKKETKRERKDREREGGAKRKEEIGKKTIRKG